MHFTPSNYSHSSATAIDAYPIGITLVEATIIFSCPLFACCAVLPIFSYRLSSPTTPHIAFSFARYHARGLELLAPSL